MSAALGVGVDPAAGLNYRRAKETGDLQQEISSLRLQLQLEQLQRDALLYRAKLSQQTEPLNADLGKLSADGPTAAVAGATGPETDALFTKLEGRLSALLTQLATEAKPIATASTSINPIDDFRDRQAYLGLLRSARNAAALDELHDQGNSALIRINFQATVVPDAAYPRSLGAVQVKVDPSSFDDRAKAVFLREWLDHINLRNTSRDAAGAFLPSSDARSLQHVGAVQIASVAGYEIALPTVGPVASRNGLLTDLQEAEWTNAKNLSGALGVMSSWRLSPDPTTPLFVALCDEGEAANVPQELRNRFNEFKKAEHVTRMRVATHEYVRMAEFWVKSLGAKAPAAPNADLDYQKALAFQQELYEITQSIPQCAAFARSIPVKRQLVAWGPLESKLGSVTQRGKARIYEVGPHEQVQQMSTVARSANSLALAASLAASAPSSGVGGNAALGYSRQAMGRAATQERVPSVVGYTVGGAQTFGWVLGPRASLDPKGKIDVEQMLKPYDLSVDMSVPSWWPKLTLKLTKLWGPSPNELTRGGLDAKGREESSLEIPMTRRAPDFDWFTQELTGNSSSTVTVEEVKGGLVNACSATTLLVSGRNVWRADKVLVFGHLLDSSAITISPDMRGILLSVPPIPPLAGNQSREPLLHVLTPFGRGIYRDLAYASSPSGDDCKPKKAEAVVDPTKLAIEKISPDLYFTVPASFTLTIQGRNLNKVTKVTLHGQPGTAQVAAGNTTMSVSFTSHGTQSIPASDGAKLEFFTNASGKGDEVAETRLVRIARQTGG